MIRLLWLFWIGSLIIGCQSHEEILLIPLEGGAPRWLAVETEAQLLATHVNQEARWLVAQAIARATCLSAAVVRAPDMFPDASDELGAAHSTPSQARRATSRSVRGPIDPNTASLRQLEALPRVGPATARAIVEGRPYARVEDLRRVRGIGPATFEGMRSMLQISGTDGH